MTFIAPVPWEADAFYAQPGMADEGLSLNQWPVGTGPFMMTEFIRDRRTCSSATRTTAASRIRAKASRATRPAGLLADCGKPMPFVDKLYVTIEKESVPRKEKFLQGYSTCRRSSAPTGASTSATTPTTPTRCRRRFEERGLQVPADDRHLQLVPRLQHARPGRRQRRHAGAAGEEPQAAPGALDRHRLGRGLRPHLPEQGRRGRAWAAAAGPLRLARGNGRLPQPGDAPVVDGKVVRRSIDEAKKLLAEAGYPEGRDAKTGRPLVLNYDYQRAVTPESKVENDWMVHQFAKLGIQLEVRATDYNQFQDKMLKGKHQIFWAGWLADYPDAENFLFLLYGPNAKSKSQGENVANYENPEFDKLFASCRRSTTGRASSRSSTRWWPSCRRTRRGRSATSRGAAWRSAVGLQRQAQHPDPRHGEVLPRRPAAARAKQAEWNRPSGGRSRCCWPSSRRRSSRPGASYQARQRATAAPVPAPRGAAARTAAGRLTVARC